MSTFRRAPGLRLCRRPVGASNPWSGAAWASTLYGSSLRDWYAANDGGTITAASNVVSAWGDKGPAARGLTQGTAGNRPSVVSAAFPTGRNGIRFVSANTHFLAASDAGLQTDFGVLKPSTFALSMIVNGVGASPQAVWDLCNPASAGTNDRYGEFVVNWNSVAVRRGNGVNVNFPVGLTAGTRLVMVVRHDGTNLYADAKYQLGGGGSAATWASGATLADSQIAGLARLTLGARVQNSEATPSLPSDCTIGEFVAAARFSADAEAVAVRDQLWMDWFGA
ncbi:hypothetical protein M0638_27820 [Roseomonas sp. NAR14]|uniref:Uncharacterized protein n=1 Tax=Roseomonas acroporae TaxID=2937791 RepID=A0A9X1YLI1_9PROT|nr:hypothetical protein [Roseomonas acroporae]MCK8788161.1 hypothetical protein [Roseomonas acroporae]